MDSHPKPPACDGARGATIALHGIAVRYGDTLAVSEVELEIAGGEFVVFLGPSGSGKSTLLRTINRLVEPSAGTIAIDEVDVRSLDPVQLRRGIGYVIQGVGLFPHLTVGENIAIVPSLLGWDAARTAARVTTLLALMGLAPEYGGRYPRELSGGEQQRVGVARALAAEPRALLMDEPFGALDTIVRAALQDEIRRIQRELGTTIVFVTHDIDEALRLADRIVVIDAGRLIQVDTPECILAAPADETVRSLVGIDAASRRFADARPLVERTSA
jgi:osmoprotectant transport system ATP-binding protein